MFQLRRDMRNKLDDNLFMKMFKASLKNLSNVDDNFCKKDSSKDALTALKKKIYVKWMKKRNYLTKLNSVITDVSNNFVLLLFST